MLRDRRHANHDAAGSIFITIRSQPLLLTNRRVIKRRDVWFNLPKHTFLAATLTQDWTGCIGEGES